MLNSDIHIQIIVGSTRPSRVGLQVGEWVKANTLSIEGVTYELIDLAEVNLPIFDEPTPPLMDRYTHEHTKKWAERIKRGDGYILVTPEYNHSMPASLKNALDYLFKEWNNKAVGFVSYGSFGGVRAVEHLRQVAGELAMADIRTQLAFMLSDDFENYSQFTPRENSKQTLEKLVHELISWSKALKQVRQDNK